MGGEVDDYLAHGVKNRNREMGLRTARYAEWSAMLDLLYVRPLSDVLTYSLHKSQRAF